MDEKIRKKLIKDVLATSPGSKEYENATKSYLDFLKQEQLEKDNSEKNVQKEKELLLREQELKQNADKDSATLTLERDRFEQSKIDNNLNREESRKTRRWGIIGSIISTVGSATTALLVCGANNKAQEKRANADRQFYADQINNVLEYEETGVIHSTGTKTVLKDGLKGPKI